jgi:putative membrane protein insertion efficiency factor
MTTVWTIFAKLPARLLVAAVRLYQITLSPWIGQSCRFQPTCSNYMIEAVEKYGFWSGLWRGLKRIGRCHPLHAGGYDPP